MVECINKKKNLELCTCSYNGCSNHAVCCECLRSHWKNRELPACLFPAEIEKTYDRSLANFIRVWSKEVLF
ncbi:MAG: DUF6485 family protein [Candidatus Omnitrophica bacterium]|nr:DUF6485 family protein [Candidatus Omnitrophota bacterium]